MTQPIEPVRTFPPAGDWLAGVRRPVRGRVDRSALVALAVSLLGLFPVGIVLAVLALRRIRRWGLRGRRVATAALAVSGCWALAFAAVVGLGVTGHLPGQRVAIEQVAVGRCFDADLSDGTRQVRPTGCGGAHAGEAYARVTVSGQSGEQRENAATGACATAFAGFVGLPYEQSGLDMYYVLLDDHHVADGNVLCLLGGRDLTGSMRGTRR